MLFIFVLFVKSINKNITDLKMPRGAPVNKSDIFPHHHGQ